MKGISVRIASQGSESCRNAGSHIRDTCTVAGRARDLSAIPDPAIWALQSAPEREYVVASDPFLHSWIGRQSLPRPARLWREVLMALNTTTSRRDGVIV